MNRFLSVLFWSVIAAAFIGPGTVTTAASAGSGYGHALLWALLFSTLACLLLQEASARLTVVSERNLGQALRERYRRGTSGIAVLLLVLGAVVVGCAAYEAGNILGGVAGAALGTNLGTGSLTLVTGSIAAALLFLGAPKVVARSLSVLVAVMGVAFLVTAWRLQPPVGALMTGSLVPSMPSGAGVLILGLVGTTVVPYNLFLGSGLARGQSLPELRFGLTVAVLLGGAISMGILVVGSAVEGAFGFEALADVLGRRVGPWARPLFAAGLFSAGLTSAVTAPLAAAITARSLFSNDGDARWGDRSWRFRGVWAGVLAIGIGCGATGIRPIPAILAAQALNGILLPFVAVFLLLAVNDRRLMGDRHLNGPLVNAAMVLVVVVTIVLGVAGVSRSAASTFGFPRPAEGTVLLVAACLAIAVAVPVGRGMLNRRRIRRDR